MAEFPSLPMFTDAFLADTIHLNTEETGAYLLLLFVAWRQPACALPDSDKDLAKWARCTAKRWRKLKPRVMAFWALENSFWFQKRLKKERDYLIRRSSIARQNGALGGRPKLDKSRGLDNPAGSSWDTQTGTQGQSKTKAPIPKPIPKERERGARSLETYLAEDWVLPSDWRAWATKRSAPHAHMIDLEAEKFRAFWVAKEAMRASWRAAWEKWWLDTVGRPPSQSAFKAGAAKGSGVRDTSKPFNEYKAEMIAAGHYKE